MCIKYWYDWHKNHKIYETIIMIEELRLHRYSYEIISIGNQFEIKVLPASMTKFIEYVAFFDIDEMFWDQSHI